MEKRDLNEEIQSKIPKIAQSLNQGKEVTLLITQKGLKVKEAAIKIIK